MKKVTMFIAALSSGGAEHQITILSNFLNEKGYDLELVTYSDIPDHYDLNAGINRIKIASGKSKFVKTLGVVKFFLTHKTDVVISFGSRDNMLSLFPLLFRKEIKYIAGERCVTYGRLKWYQKLNYKHLYKRADYIVANSFTQGNDIKGRFPYLADKTSTITNYTDLEAYKLIDKSPNVPLRIGIFCRYVEQKNYRRFAEVVRILNSSNSGKFKIDWYGNMGTKDSPNPNYEEFKSLVDKYDLNEVLVLNDHIKNVKDIIPTFDILCLPSLTEGFSNSISEYICCGKPVLCSNVADNKYMVKDGTNGFLFDPKDLDDMVDKFLKIISLSPEELIKMGKESRRIAECLFDSEAFTNKYIQLIERKI